MAEITQEQFLNPQLGSAEGFAFKYNFKMYLEGILCPFQSASVANTPNGVEMNIEVHVTDKIFDLIPKTFVQIFYYDWYGSDKDKDWHLFGDGYFSGFAKYDDATGARTVSLLCRDFRMDIRKAPSVLMYQPDDNVLTMENMMNLHGVKRSYTVLGKDGLKKKVLGANRTYGGQLNQFSWITKLLSGSASGSVNDETQFVKDNNGRFFLDAFCRGIWLESTEGTTYGTFSNSRLRIEKRLYIPENQSGYRFFNQKYLNDFGGSVVMGGSMFSSVEAVMMRMAAIFQCQPYSCSTPTLNRIQDATCESISKYLTEKLKGTFGEPYSINSCMMLPPMHFTAPPNCNILFPCMYNKITWQHDYDEDLTRGYYKISNVFDKNEGATAAIVSPEKQQREVPNSLMAFNKGHDNPPLTIEERYKGVNITYGDLEYMTASRNINNDYADRVMKDPAAFKSAIAKLKNNKEYKTLSNQIDYLKSGNNAVPTDELEAKLEYVKQKLSKLASTAPPTPDIFAVLGRHAVFKFLMNRFAGRVINVSCDFNPYIVSGFPAVVMADDNRGEYKTLRTLIGFVQSVQHQVAAQGSASTTIIMSHVRFINEATDIDDGGNPLFIGRTSAGQAMINDATLAYRNLNYTGQSGYPKTSVEDVAASSNFYDWSPTDNASDPRDPFSRKLEFAKDILLVTAEGMKEGKTNLNFLDEKYTPNKVPLFYEEIFGQPKLNHFMVGWYVDPNNSNVTPFIYDSIHEAVEHIMADTKTMNDYNSAIQFVRRPVITEDDYFVKILGASFVVNDSSGTLHYSNESNILSKFGKRDNDAWYGLPSNNLSQFEYPSSVHGMIKDGEFSSVYEKRPVTPFLKEKREKAEAYIQEVNNRVSSTR